MPVVITDTVDIYNAFNTPIPYNRIVMYDTSSQVMDDLSSSISEAFLTTFRHELTHAVTFNMKNDFWSGFTNIFGDGFLPGCLFVTTGMAEGAAVASESSNGEGRLNDEYTTHFVKQAKIEDSFPSFYDTQGAAVNSIPAIPYYFNGPFHAYLQEKYGLEKYSKFWHYVINMNRLGMNWSFKKVFGISIRKEWKLFENSYSVPDVVKNPIENGFVNDLLPVENKLGIRFSNLYSCDTGIFYAEDMPRDKNSKEVFFIPKNDIDNDDIKPKSLFIQQLMDNFLPSSDGRFLVLSCFSTLKPNITSKIKIYDIENNSFFSVDEDGLKNGAMIKKDDDYYLVSHKYDSPYNNLVIKKIIFDSNKINGTEDICHISQDFNTFITCFTDLGNGTFAFIKKAGKDFSISVSDLSGNVIKNYDLPEGVKIRNLSFSSNILNDKTEPNENIYFSWVEEGSMPRLGILDVTTGEFSLSNVDISGGIFNPVYVHYNGGQRIAYIGCFYKENKLLTFDMNSEIVTNVKKYSGGNVYNNINIEKSETEDKDNIQPEIDKEITFTDISLLSEPYKSIKNLHKGLVIPFSLYSANMIGEKFGANSPSQFLPFGATYVTANPWNGGVIRDDLLILTGGWSYLTNSFGFEAILNQGTGTSLFSYKVDLKSEFDRKGWKQSAGELVLSSGFHFGKTSVFSIQNDFEITGGRQNNLDNNINTLSLVSFWKPELFECCAPINDSVALNISDLIYARYSTICSRGPGKFQLGGISIGLGAGYIYDSVKGHAFIVNPEFKAYIPKLIPIESKRGFTYHLPVKIELSLLPTSSFYGLSGMSSKVLKNSVLDTNIEAVLFGIDIQKSIPYFEALFVNEFSITGGYCSTIAAYKGQKKSSFQLPYIFEYFGNLGNGKSAYLDSVYLKISMKVTPNIGIFAGGVNFNLYGQASYPINVIDEKYRKFNFSFGIGANF